MSRINLIRPDGTVASATPEQAEKLIKLGYRLETSEELADRAREQVERESFQTAGHQIIAGLEGVASGLTLSGSDVLLDDASTRARARYNPGTRIAGEVVGAVLPAIATAGSTAPASGAMTAGRVLRGALAATPAGAVSRLAGGRVVAGAALEGAAAGAAGEVTQAVLSGEPVLAENVLTGAGWGTVFGAGIGSAALGVGKGLKAIGRADDVADAVPAMIDRDAHVAVKARFNEATDAYADVLSRAKAAKATTELYGKQLDELKKFVPPDLTPPSTARALKAEENLLSTLKAMNITDDIPAVRKMVAEGTPADPTKSLYTALKKYDNAGNELLQAQAAHERLVSETLQNSIKNQSEQAIIGEQFNSAKTAFDDNVKLASALKTLRKLPDNPAAFLKMKNVEELWGAVDSVMSSGVRGIDGLKAGIKDSIEQLTAKAGLDLSGKSPATQLREVWRAARDVQLAAPVAARTSKTPDWFRGLSAQIGGRLASQQAANVGAGAVGRGIAFFGAKSIVLDGVLGLAGNVRSKIHTAVEKMGPVAKKMTPAVAGKSIPLTMSILGRDTKDTSDTRDLAKKRVEEVNALAPTIKEGAFKVVEPFIEEHTDFGYNLYSSIVGAFNALYEMMPKDPGTSFSGFKSLWKPSDIQAAQINSLLKVFHYPIETIEGMLSNLGKRPVSAIEVEAIKRMYPEAYNLLRDGVLNKLMESGDEFDYATQVQMSTLTGTPMHSSLLPQNIAAAQSLFIPKPQDKPKTPGNNRGGGRPPSVEAPTPGQILANGGRA